MSERIRNCKYRREQAETVRYERRIHYYICNRIPLSDESCLFNGNEKASKCRYFKVREKP